MWRDLWRDSICAPIFVARYRHSAPHQLFSCPASFPAAIVGAQNLARFTQQLRAEFDTLHEGNAVRFGLGPLELSAWRQQVPAEGA
jgi:hypothetical protein